MPTVLPLALGALVGFPLGLTGAGGAILAVPVLVYGLSVPPHDAVGVSLVTVGATAWVGAIDRIRAKEADVKAGLALALAGMASTPLGAWLNTKMPEQWLLGSFAVLMFVVALRMVRGSRPSRDGRAAAAGSPDSPDSPDATDSPGSPDSTGTVRLVRLIAMGLAIGVLAGLFGVGGGFLIVPSLVLLAGQPIQTAVATSLTVIALVSTSGVISFIAAHGELNVPLASLFALGSFGGLAIGSRIGRRVSGTWLRKAFAVFVLSASLYIGARAFLG
ncbi:MAG: sulfite exporter TauE/SafE family protein [Candidatus Eisenbacteria bacterium]|nr:sulfite exporter TauE/SafE family protein [Candidatus Eisenbacteria bacterium]